MEAKTITRNEVTLPLQNFKILKGVNKDKEYPAPNITDSTKWDEYQKWVGLSNVINCVQTWLKRTFQEIYFDNVDETTGVFNEAKFLKEAEDFTAAGMKLKEIKDKLDEVVAQLTLRVQSASGTDYANPEWQAGTNELAEYINVLKAMAEARSRKTKETEAEPAVAVA